ncbi:MAG: dolichyl-phosphate mannose synthase [Methanobacteriales archaeon Met13]
MNFFKEHSQDIVVVLPAYNEAPTIKDVMEELLGLGVQLVVVDDGSRDDTYQIALEYVENPPRQVHLYRHALNLGLGATLQTGLEAALLRKPRAIVTFDADGQHHAQDLYGVVRPVVEGQAEAVIGIRDFKKMPLRKRFGNGVMNLITLLFYGHRVADSQSGFRAFSPRAARLMELHSSGYGVSSEMVGEVFRHGWRLEEVPITTIYTDYSLSKGTDTKIGLKILIKLIRDVFK